MAYKRYIRKNGKVYGPYMYHSRREGGKVISEYRGKPKENKNKNFLLPLFLVLSLVFLFVFFPVKFTGEVISEIHIFDENKLKAIESSVSIIEFKISKVERGSVTVNTTKIQYGAVLGRPVKWTKKIELSEAVNLSIEIPLIAENISILNIVRPLKVIEPEIEIIKTIKILQNVKDMSKIMMGHDIAITAGGITLLELAGLGIPSIIICGEKFETETATYFSKNGFGLNLGFGKNITKKKIREATNELINNYQLINDKKIKKIF